MTRKRRGPITGRGVFITRLAGVDGMDEYRARDFDMGGEDS